VFEKKFDVVIVGSGSGMKVGASAIEHGIEIAMLEHGLLGGTCLNNGCIPSKMLIYPADVLAALKDAEKLGIKAEIESIDFQSIMRRTRELVKGEREPIEQSAMNHPALTWYKETGEFVGDYTLKVGKEKIKGDKIFISSGTRPLILPIPGVDQVEYLTNETVFDLDERPERMVIVGGGFVGVEFAHFFSQMGTEVTVLEMGERIVAQEEPEISQLLHQELMRSTQVLVRHRVEALEQEGDTKIVRVKDLTDDATTELRTDQILMAAGRISNADLLRPEKTGVETDEKGYIKVNEYLETTKPNIWAFGDAIGVHMYRHAANYEASVAWGNAHIGLHEGGHGHDHKTAVDFSAVPHAVYSHPQIGSVGLTESQAREKGLNIMVGKWNYADTAKGSAMGEPPGFVKAIVESETYKILGCHVIGYAAPVIVQGAVDVMNCREGTALNIINSMHIHPSLTEVLRNAFGNIS
jgi:dihydrolipoamide dehydrogenase